MATAFQGTGVSLPGPDSPRTGPVWPQAGTAARTGGAQPPGGTAQTGGAQPPGGTAKAQPGSGQGSAKGAGDTVQLSPQAAALVAKLKARDADVHAHEEAHAAAGGALITGGPDYTYQQGPDGHSYAVGGDVTIDTSGVPGNPAATLAKARQVQAAALAPADPSGQDENVAAQAAAMAAQAAAQLAAGSGTPAGGTRTAAPGGGHGGAAPRGGLVDVTA
ncbi:MAG: putative metalloprotease CJM1_0395 family protein [Holophaga sp.]